MKSTQSYSTCPDSPKLGVFCRTTRAIVTEPFAWIHDIHFGRFRSEAIYLGYEGYLCSITRGRNTSVRRINLSICCDLLKECALCLSTIQEKPTHRTFCEQTRPASVST